MNKGRIIPLILAGCMAIAVSAVPLVTSAHRSGCHNLHTCPSDSNTYICGDLGYPCDGSTSVKNISLSAVQVPLAIEKAFISTFGRKPTDTESIYWKKRFRAEKNSIFKLRNAMAWHKAHESFGPSVSSVVKTALVKVQHINALFRAVYDGRNPTISENLYWRSRIKDKPTEHALKGAMLFHKLNGLQH